MAPSVSDEYMLYGTFTFGTKGDRNDIQQQVYTLKYNTDTSMKQLSQLKFFLPIRTDDGRHRIRRKLLIDYVDDSKKKYIIAKTTSPSTSAADTAATVNEEEPVVQQKSDIQYFIELYEIRDVDGSPTIVRYSEQNQVMPRIPLRFVAENGGVDLPRNLNPIFYVRIVAIAGSAQPRTIQYNLRLTLRACGKYKNESEAITQLETLSQGENQVLAKGV